HVSRATPKFLPPPTEKKKYFLPANCVGNSPLFSSTFIPQTGSFVIDPLRFEICFPLQPVLSAKLLPFSVAFQVADPIRFFVHAFVFFKKPSEKSPPPVPL